MYVYIRETWTILKAEIVEIRAFEVWCWRRALKIPWTEKVRNVEVFRWMNTLKSILNTLKLRRKGLFIGNSSWTTNSNKRKNKKVNKEEGGLEHLSRSK